MITFFAVLLLCILRSNATKVNIEVTLQRQDIVSLFTEDEIWGIQYVNNSKDIVQLNVVIDKSKSMALKLNKDKIISFNMIAPDIDEVIRKSRIRINNTAKWTSSQAPDLFFLEYRNWAEYVVFIDALLIRHPLRASRSIIGQTIEGHDIQVIRLTGNTDNPENNPGFWIQAEVHAREWLANMGTMYILNALLEGYGTDTDITDIMNNVNIYIAPTVNVDGYIYTWTNDRMWRKNRRANSGGTYGVDINRNWGPAGTWCTSGSSTNPSSNTYCGTAPFSEPETEAAAQFIMNPLNNITAAIDMHTSGPLILWPWQYTYTQLPGNDYTFFQNLGAALEKSIEDVHGITYRSIQGSDLYPHSGGMIDFCWDLNRIAFTFEGRGPGFDPPASNIIPAGEEQLQAIVTLAKTLYIE